MSLSIGIVGLPNVGKSTLFNALTDSSVLAANYPFATIEPNTGIVPVPNERLQKLAELYHTNKVIPATVTFVDIAGLVAGASKGEGLGNQFLANIRQCDAICHVVRAFKNDDILHVSDLINPKNDIEIINTELILADLQSIEKRLPRMQKEARSDTKLGPFVEALAAAQAMLDSGKPLFAEARSMKHEVWDWLHKELQLLTMKPVIYLFNIDEETLNNKSAQDNLSGLVSPAKAVFVCAKLEEELHGLEKAEAIELLESYGVTETGLNKLIRTAYDTLDLQSYLTAGPKEVRAWTIKKGATAPQAAGVIHTDFERGFIAAQVIDYKDLVTAGSEPAAKAAGKVSTVGKTYVMQPGDVVEFRFNV